MKRKFSSVDHLVLDKSTQKGSFHFKKDLLSLMHGSLSNIYLCSPALHRQKK